MWRRACCDRAGDGSVPYDGIRDRIIFTIADVRGRVVSFGGRMLDPEARAKYLSGSESPLFQKGRVGYSLHEARSGVSAVRGRRGGLLWSLSRLLRRLGSPPRRIDATPPPSMGSGNALVGGRHHHAFAS